MVQCPCTGLAGISLKSDLSRQNGRQVCVPLSLQCDQRPLAGDTVGYSCECVKLLRGWVEMGVGGEKRGYILGTTILLCSNFSGDSVGKESACNAGDPGSISGFHLSSLEEGMATYSSILAWKIPSTEEPGGLQSTGSQRVRHD
ncbi:unnamed protein product [Rangifer tarandus platyrhynchus]|uniref:Uncharacterized protein n=1 Tax=Rangifer tarandus platyrhynchus TaxID=3082113 RepID=A0AC59YL20_RANTA